jgi:CBS domain-containing protein
VREERFGSREEATVSTHTDVLVAADVMTRDFVTAEPMDTIGETAEKLASHDLGSALVVEGGELVGIITSRDVVRSLAVRAHPSDARVREFMSETPATAAPDTPVDELAHTMVEGGFHHLPVVEHGRPVGVVGFRSVGPALGKLGPGW